MKVLVIDHDELRGPSLQEFLCRKFGQEVEVTYLPEIYRLRADRGPIVSSTQENVNDLKLYDIVFLHLGSTPIGVKGNGNSGSLAYLKSHLLVEHKRRISDENSGLIISAFSGSVSPSLYELEDIDWANSGWDKDWHTYFHLRQSDAGFGGKGRQIEKFIESISNIDFARAAPKSILLGILSEEPAYTSDEALIVAEDVAEKLRKAAALLVGVKNDEEFSEILNTSSLQRPLE